MATKSAPSIYDVATAAGVSPGTVSRVLNRRGNISDATRAMVLETARNMQFRSRISTRKMTLAIVTDKAQYATLGGFLSCINTHLTEEFSKADLAIQIFTEANLDRLGEHTIDGIISISWDTTTIRRLRELHQKTNVPVLLFNRCDICEFASIQSDYKNGGRKVGQYLYERGHQQIAYIIEDHSFGLDHRLKGIVDFLAQEGVTYDPELVVLTRHSRMEDSLRRVMTLNPTALFVGSEDLVLEVLSTLQDQLGLRVPNDISLVGMENIHVNRFTSPPVTSLRQPFEQMAADAMQLVLQMIQAPQQVEHRVLDNQWIERLSVRSIL